MTRRRLSAERCFDRFMVRRCVPSLRPEVHEALLYFDVFPEAIALRNQRSAPGVEGSSRRRLKEKRRRSTRRELRQNLHRKQTRPSSRHRLASHLTTRSVFFGNPLLISIDWAQRLLRIFLYQFIVFLGHICSCFFFDTAHSLFCPVLHFKLQKPFEDPFHSPSTAIDRRRSFE